MNFVGEQFNLHTSIVSLMLLNTQFSFKHEPDGKQKFQNNWRFTWRETTRNGCL